MYTKGEWRVDEVIEFRCKADFTFRAEGIDDAFAKLSEHFEDLKAGKDSDLIELGEIHIEPVRDLNKEV